MGRSTDAKQRLLEAAIELIWTRSYGAVTVDDLCEKAGVKKGSFYYFFKSKNELVAAAIEQKWNEVRPNYDRMFSASIPPLERLRNLYEYAYSSQKELQEKHGCVLGCPFSSIGTEVIAQDKVLRDAIQRVIRPKIRYIESALRDLQAEGMVQGQDLPTLAKALYAYMEGALAQARIQNDLELVRNLQDGAMKFLGLGSATLTPVA